MRIFRGCSVSELYVRAVGIDVDDYRARTVHFLCENILGKAVQHLAVNHTLNRTRAELGVKAFIGQQSQSRRRNLDRKSVV